MIPRSLCHCSVCCSVGKEGIILGVRGATSEEGRHNHSSQFQLWHMMAPKYVKLLPWKSSRDFTLLLSTSYRTEPKTSHSISTLLNAGELHSILPLSIIYANSVPVKLSIIYLSSSMGYISPVNVKGKYPQNVHCFALSRVLHLCWP